MMLYMFSITVNITGIKMILSIRRTIVKFQLRKKARKNSLPIPRSHKLLKNPIPANSLGVGLTLSYPQV